MSNNKKPLIGILPLYDSKQRSFWMFPGYINGVIAAGGLPIVLSVLSDLDDIKKISQTFDGFLFTGGQDVDPEYYGEPLLSCSNEIYPPRDFMEKNLLLNSLELNKPIFGVCRGLQFINVVLGGSLYQDIDTQMKRKIKLLHEQNKNYEEPMHDVFIEKGTRLYEIVKTEKMRVNTMHHQGISELSPQLLASARTMDGLIEAIEIPEIDFGLAVQWHPEFLWSKDERALNLFKAFIDACRK